MNKMVLLTNQRGKYLEVIKKIEPSKIMSFSYPNGLEPLLQNKEIMLIINTQFKPNKHPEKWKIRLNNKLHAKLIIGEKGIFVGSCNFSDNSLFYMHEIAIVSNTKKGRLNAEKYFKELWERSSPI